MSRNSSYDALLNELCIDFGFCGSIVDGKPLHIDMFLPETGTVSADDFTNCVFRAEGMDPNGEAAWKHAVAIREAFIRHMGEDLVDARSLK